jgi:diguanylate cyclase (GGDEF)-like protein/PAS domain S-box-containing protein
MKWETRWSIRTRLRLLLLALVVPFLIYLCLSSWYQARQHRAELQQRMLGIARLSAARLDDHIGNVGQLLGVLSTVVGSTADDIPNNDALLQDIAHKLPAHVSNVGVWTAEGKNIGALSLGIRTRGTDITHRKFFVDALQGDGLVIEAPVMSLANGENIGLFSMPVIRHGRVAAIVALSTRMNQLQALLASDSSMPAGAVMTVTDASGIVLARSVDPQKWVGKNVLSEGTGGFAESLRRGDGVREGPSAEGVDRIAGFTTAKRAPWLVYVGVPTQVAFASSRHTVYQNLAVGGIILLLGLLLAHRIAERIADPLRHLSDDAEAFERGDVKVRSRISQGGEIGRLASTLNRAADALVQRTEDLHQSKDQIRLITDNLPVMISYLDRDLRFVFANRVYQDWLGMEPDMIVGSTMHDYYSEAEYAQYILHFEAALAGTRTTFERDLSALGRVRRVEVTLLPHVQRDAVLGLFVLVQDVTESREAEARLARSEERLTLALEGANLALFDWDITQNRLYHSPQAATMRGFAPEAVTTDPALLRAHIHPDDVPLVMERTRAALAGAVDRYEVEFRVSTASGRWLWLGARGRVVQRDERGRAERLAGVYIDINERKAIAERLRMLAEFDVLTGLPNRALFMDRFGHAIERAARSAEPMALLFLDIDHFKTVNDTLGHEAGDEVLKTFAQVMQSSVRSSDTVARLGGDEFTIILEGLGGPEDARVVAGKIVAKARSSIAAKGQVVTVSTSIGVAMVERGEVDTAAVLRRADAALYEAKRLGRDRYAFHNSVNAARKFREPKDSKL